MDALVRGDIRWTIIGDLLDVLPVDMKAEPKSLRDDRVCMEEVWLQHEERNPSGLQVYKAFLMSFSAKSKTCEKDFKLVLLDVTFCFC